MSNLMTDMANPGLTEDMVASREALRHAVQRHITCPFSGRLLDIRTAVLVEGYKDGRQIAASISDPEHFAAREAEIRRAADEHGITLVITRGAS